MNKLLFLFLLIICISCNNTENTSDNKASINNIDSINNRKSIVDSLTTQHQNIKAVSVKEHSHFKNRVMPALQYLVIKEGVKGNNNFYIEDVMVNDKNENEYISPWVYWAEKNMLILFEPHQENEYDATELYLSRRKLDLIKDVVATEGDINGSTYIISEKYKQEHLTLCKKGTHVLIKK